MGIGGKSCIQEQEGAEMRDYKTGSERLRLPLVLTVTGMDNVVMPWGTWLEVFLDTLAILHINRTERSLSVEEVHLGNSFVLSALEDGAVVVSLLEYTGINIEDLVEPEDIEYMKTENRLLAMGNRRN